MNKHKKLSLLYLLEEQENEKEEIQIIPMIDVMLFLLTFFILYTLNVLPMLYQNIKLPTSSTVEQNQIQEPLKVYIDKEGNIKTEKFGTGVEALKQYLKTVKSPEEAIVILIPDKDATAQSLMVAIDTLKENKITKISIAGEKK
ncbi:biopolymer transporter ExbD [Sulfurihydrogenibium sp.]|jgi:biopolymer transport protein ExbD|uniref:ExbD/TolR family protein n=1 Tax=Sulfurihydrogenibium sp. TaxID=2053621 RepID=UPI00261A1111|nr:biopolymer transporter ExbD [Sulfurihydrogenibium sp.]